MPSAHRSAVRARPDPRPRHVPLRLALVWGAAAMVLGTVAVVLLWTGSSIHGDTTCPAPDGGSGLACGLPAAWGPVLATAGVFGVAAALAGVVGMVAARR